MVLSHSAGPVSKILADTPNDWSHLLQICRLPMRPTLVDVTLAVFRPTFNSTEQHVRWLCQTIVNQDPESHSLIMV